MPRITDDFDSVPLGSAPDASLWAAIAGGVGAAGLTASSGPLVEQDADGRYLAPGLPVFSSGAMSPTAPIARLELFLGMDATGIARIVAPVCAGLAAPGSSVVAGSYQYLYVDLVRTAGVSALRAYLTDPATVIFGSPAAALLVASVSLGSVSGSGRLVVECGPRFLRAWWFAGARAVFRRRTPDLGAMIPWIELERWGMAVQGGKIRSAATLSRANDQEDVAFDMGAPRSAPVTLAIETSVSDSTTVESIARPVMVTYEVSHQTKRRRSSLIFNLTGEGATGHLADTFCQRLDSSQTIVPIPDFETTDVVACSIADGVSGVASNAVAVFVTDDPGSGPDAGIGSGRSSMADGGELVLVAPESRQDGQLEESQQDYATQTGSRDAFAQTSNRKRRSWALNIPVRPDVHLRPMEMLVSSCTFSRPVWARPPFDARPITVYLTSMSHTMAAFNSCIVRTSIEEA